MNRRRRTDSVFSRLAEVVMGLIRRIVIEILSGGKRGWA